MASDHGFTLKASGLPAPGELPAAAIRSVCGFLGSFDPVHRGHLWMARHLARRFDRVVMLVPGHHFHKQIRFPQNATLAQRLEMIERVRGRLGPRVVTGLAHEVLFVRLAGHLARRFPAASVTFGMGDDTYRKLLASRQYVERHLGQRWRPEDQEALDRLRDAAVVFDRSGRTPGVKVPDRIRQISSTRVRACLRRPSSAGAPGATRARELERMIEPEVARYIRQRGLYRES